MTDLLSLFKEKADEFLATINQKGGVRATIDGLRRQMAEADRRRAIGRVKSELRRLDRQISEMITAVGVQAVALQEAGQLTSPELQPLCQHIVDLKAALSQQQAELAQLEAAARAPAAGPAETGAMTCANCGRPVPAGGTFCPYCGAAVAPSAASAPGAASSPERAPGAASPPGATPAAGTAAGSAPSAASGAADTRGAAADAGSQAKGAPTGQPEAARPEAPPRAEAPRAQVPDAAAPKAVCAHCGAPLKPGARFCSKCGRPT